MVSGRQFYGGTVGVLDSTASSRPTAMETSNHGVLPLCPTVHFSQVLSLRGDKLNDQRAQTLTSSSYTPSYERMPNSRHLPRKRNFSDLVMRAREKYCK